MTMKEYIRENRERIASVLTNVGYTVVAAVVAIFIGWALYRLYGYLSSTGELEWKKLLSLCTKKGMAKVLGVYFRSFLWTGLVLTIGWAMAMAGDILETMVPEQSKDDSQSAVAGLTLVTLGGLACALLPLVGWSMYFFIPLAVCFVGDHIAKVDDDEKKDREIEDTRNELAEAKQRINELEKQLTETSGQDSETN
ncbi:MAG: hypothetical protein IJK41_09135 [Muribaculaceae bacterium]|nr:hypothetical protein [Muribaculaceae bacterium]